MRTQYLDRFFFLNPDIEITIWLAYIQYLAYTKNDKQIKDTVG